MARAAPQWDAAVVALHVLLTWCHAGITSINCSGHIWVEPATIFKMGTNISIYCQATIKNCQPRKIYFYKNGIRERFHITRINKTTARLWYTNFLEPHASVYCTAECPGRFGETLICGEDISSGYPPDSPDGVTCVIYENSGSMTCSWDTGTLTYVDTKYVLHVKSLETEEEQQYLTSSCINISTDSLQGGKEYLVWVRAVNALGTGESKHLQIHLDDIVIPSAPIISRAENIDTPVPKTVIHWNSQARIERVSCEMRHKAGTDQTWNVKKFDTNLTYVQQSEFYLEPNTKYAFQVRCREAGRRFWQPWSLPFFHKTPEIDGRQDIGLLSGMVTCAVTLSILALVGMFNRSLRTGIKRRILFLMPKWLQEDIPNMENSNVVKMLQEQSEFMNNNSSEQVLYADPVITEIEIFLPAHKPTDHKQERSMDSLETRGYLQNPLLASTTVVYLPDLNPGYKPQISHFCPGENRLLNSDEIDSSTFKPPADSLDLGKNPSLKQYPNFSFSISSMNSPSNTLFLEELSLIVNPGECSPPDPESSVQGDTTALLENAPAGETVPEQTLLPDEFVSCLGLINEELPSINSYFPQNILESHFSRISLLEK
ncbi:interleukin-23 receptor [Otolemur garnettii]|uniref:interleukin-23 receptor n=1 Tax=Otolemur garnettii TaxID=30611 RepID=UPI0006444D25|nr:interleukin-23 receptor [Otolemur garnettii]